MAGAVRLASPPLHSFAYAHRRSGARLSLVVEPLSREFSSTAPNATKKTPERRLFYGRGSKIGSAATALIRKAHRRSGVRLSFAVEPLSREFSSTAPNATKKPPERRLFYGRGSKIGFAAATLIRLRSPAFWHPPFVCGRTTFS